MGFDIKTDFGSAFDLVGKIIDKVFPDKDAADKAKLEMLRLQQNGDLAELEKRYSAIIAEANSADPWTSRARPSFMYVMYVMILSGIPMGVLFWFRPDVAEAVCRGLRLWLETIPEQMWWLFGAGYLGYTGSRMFEKRSGVK